MFILEEINTSSKEVFEDFESDLAFWIITLDGPTQETAETNDTLKQTAGS